MRKLILGILVCLISPCLRANEPAPPPGFLNLLLRRPTVDFHVAAAAATADAEEETGQPDQALKQWALALRDEHGHIDPTALYRANVLRRDYLKRTGKSGNSHASIESVTNPASWVTRGPLNVGGRTRCVVVDPNHASTVFAGSVSGGLWKSTDGGTTWTKWGNHMTNIAISTLIFDPSDATSNTMYMGTGERAYGDGIQGAGVFKSTNGGVDWTQLSQTATWSYVSRLAMSGGVLLAAANGGIWRSTNNGSSWTNVLPTDPYYGYGFTVAFNPNNSNLVVGSILDWDSGLSAWTVRAVWSSNAGASFTQVTSQPATLADYYEAFIEPVWAKATPDLVYASAGVYGGNPSIEYGDLWKSTDDGHTYVKVNTSGNTGCRGFQCGLWVDPTDSSLIITSGIDLHRSTDSGVTLTNLGAGGPLTHYLHADIHTIVNPPDYDGSSNRTVYLGTDGGMFKTADIRNAVVAHGPFAGDFTDLNVGYQTTQFYYATGDNGGVGLFIGGTQDNATLVTSQLNEGSRNATDARLLNCCDGGAVALDPIDKSYVYVESQWMVLARSTDGGQNAYYLTSPPDSNTTNTLFIAPFTLDPNVSTRMLAGGLHLWRSDTVRSTPTWTAIRNGSQVHSAIAVARWNSDLIWVAQTDGAISKTTNGTGAATWTDIHVPGSDTLLPDRMPTSILIDPDNSNVVYITYGGYTSPNLWFTTDGGSTWTSISGTGLNSLPSVPFRTIARHPRNSKALYVGTDIGLYQTLDGGSSWSTSTAGSDDAPVDNLTFVVGADMLLVATHGRGLWTVDTSDVTTYAPTNLVATARSTSSVSVGWTGYSGAASYELQRKAGAGSWTTLTASGTSYTDSGLASNTTYLYRVRAVLSGGVKTGFSNIDLATTVTFDHDGTLATTAVKGSHLTEIRNATNDVLTAAGLPTLSFTAPTPGVTPILASDITVLRTALTQAYRAIGLADPGFTDTIVAGTPIKAVHFQELRNLVK